MRYSEEIIEQVRNANDIVDVIGQYVRLTKKGSNYFGLCPFHGEKTASFSVSPQKQIYYCFGCGAGGNVISFIMEYENYTFSEALKYLADRARIELPTESSTEHRGFSELKSRLYEINKVAALFYYNKLIKGDNKTGYRYFSGERRISNKMITHFGLGYADKTSPDELYRYLKSKGFADEDISKSGLCIIDDRGNKDKFWNRVMFPIMDTNNRVVGFGGRVMGEGMPKYLNSPETPIFDKSSILYGLNFAKKSRKNYILICEGYMDVIALHQAGFTNAVASLGTAFNERHARLLKRYTDNVILTQDSDKAGTNAKLRAFPILREAGLNVKVLDMGEYKDPDEFIKAMGPDAYEERILKAKNAFLYEIEVIKSSYDLSDPAMKTRFYEDTAERLCSFTEPLERDNYVQAVSHEHMIPYEELKSMVNIKALYKGMKTKENQRFDPDKEVIADLEKEKNASRMMDDRQNKSVNNRQNQSAYEKRRQERLDKSVLKSERLLLSWMCARPEIIDKLSAYIGLEDFTEGIFRDTAAEIKRQHKEGILDPAKVMDIYADEPEKRKQAGAILNADALYRGVEDMSTRDLEKAVSEAVSKIRLHGINEEIEKSGNDIYRFQELMKMKNALSRLDIKL
ncbi:MAG: DNA primase [Eubacteriales bacterium]|nr:DNA primase [Eubacteriales bacterium]